MASSAKEAMNDCWLIIERYRNFLLTQPLEVTETDLRYWIENLDGRGRWSDIDYEDQMPAHWKTSEHLVRVRWFSLAVSKPGSKYYWSEAVLGVVDRALEHWIANRYQNPNWWHNCIGVPALMRDIIALQRCYLAGERLRGAVEVLKQVKPMAGGYGANTIWTQELRLIAAALNENSDELAAASRIISDEIQVGQYEGIQDDFSFHQHGPRLQQFHYGGAFLQTTTRLAWQLRGTPWEFPAEKIKILADYLLEGCQWMCRGIYTVPATIDRAVSRPGNFKHADLRPTLRQLHDLVPEREADIARFLTNQEGLAEPVVGFRAFPHSDFSAYHRPGFSCFIKLVSERTETTEVILMNQENLKGDLLHCGDHYLLRDGQEYFDLPPVWDWDLIPGVTWAQGVGKIQRRSFVGSVVDGISGLSAMDYSFGCPDQLGLYARKIWVCHGDAVICLIAGLHACGPIGPVRTALDQCMLRGPVTVADELGSARVLQEGEHCLEAKWIHHSGFAYFPLGQSALTLRNQLTNGSWKSINAGYSAKTVSAPVFLPILEHGTELSGQSCGFAIAVCDRVEEIETSFPKVQMIRNDARCQAVSFHDGAMMIAFYEPGRVSVSTDISVGVDQPCLLLVSNGQLRASDPTQKGQQVQIAVSGRSLRVLCPPGGKSSDPVSL